MQHFNINRLSFIQNVQIDVSWLNVPDVGLLASKLYGRDVRSVAMSAASRLSGHFRSTVEGIRFALNRGLACHQPVTHNNLTTAQCRNLFVMGRDQERRAFFAVYLADQVHHLQGRSAIKIAGGLIG